MGIVLFFVAHIGYLSCGLMNGKLHRLTALIILVFALPFYCFMIHPGIPDLIFMITVLVYLLISCFSLGAALGINGNPAFKWLYISGIAMVLFSDIFIALREFAEYKDMGYLVLPTYYLAQISITASLISRKIFDDNKIRFKF